MYLFRKFRKLFRVLRQKFTTWIGALRDFLEAIWQHVKTYLGFSYSSVGKSSACNAGDLGPIPGSGRSPGEVNGNPLQYSFLENPMDRGSWQAIVHGSQELGTT